MNNDGIPDLVLFNKEMNDNAKKKQLITLLLDEKGSLKKMVRTSGNDNIKINNSDYNFHVSVGTGVDLDGNGVMDYAISRTDTVNGQFANTIQFLLLNKDLNIQGTYKITDQIDGFLSTDGSFVFNSIEIFYDHNDDNNYDLLIGANNFKIDKVSHGKVYIANLNSTKTPARASSSYLG